MSGSHGFIPERPIGPPALPPGQEGARPLYFVFFNSQTLVPTKQRILADLTLAEKAREPGEGVIEVDGVKDLSKFKITNTDGEVKLEPLPPLPDDQVIEFIDLADDGTATLTVPPGTKVTVDGVAMTEQNGMIVIPSSPGKKVVEIDRPGFAKRRYVAKVRALNELKAALVEQVTEEKAQKLKETVDIGGQTIDADKDSLISLMAVGIQAMQAQAAGTAFTTPWITSDNKRIDFNAAQVLNAIKKIAKNRETASLNARDKKDRIAAAKNPGDVKKVK